MKASVTNDETEKNELRCQRSLQLGVVQIFSEKQSRKGKRKINCLAVVLALSDPGPCNSMSWKYLLIPF